MTERSQPIDKDAVDNLVERLKDAAGRMGKGYFDPRNYAADILKAATTLESLAHPTEQTDDAVVEALADIRNRILCPVGPSPSLDEVEAIASAALAKSRQ